MDCRKIEAAGVGGLVAISTFRSVRVRCGVKLRSLGVQPGSRLSPNTGHRQHRLARLKGATADLHNVPYRTWKPPRLRCGFPIEIKIDQMT
jgi:hypothetical protein